MKQAVFTHKGKPKQLASLNIWERPWLGRTKGYLLTKLTVGDKFYEIERSET